MSVKPFMVDIKDFNKRKQNQHEDIRNVFSNSSISKRRSPKLYTRTIFQRILVRLGRSLARRPKQKEPAVKTQLEVFEGSITYFVFFGRFLGIFPTIPSEQRKKYPILSRGYAIPIIICLSQLVVVILILIGPLMATINVGKIFHVSYFLTSFLCSILVIRLATKWHELLNRIQAADLDEYIDPSVKFKCNFATVAFISFVFMDNVLSISSKLAIVSDCESPNNTLYEQYIFTAHGFLFKNGVYSVPLGIMLIIINVFATFNLTFYQIFIICVSLYLQSILEKIYLKIISCNCESLAVSHWSALRQDYSRATQLVRSLDEVINGLVFTVFASNLYFVCIKIFYVSSEDSEIRPLHDYARTTTLTYNVYSTIHIIVNFFTVSLITSKVHSASLKVAPLLYSVSPQTYCVEVQRFIEQIQGDPVALTGLNFFYVTKDVILTVIATIFTYELVLLQLK